MRSKHGMFVWVLILVGLCVGAWGGEPGGGGSGVKLTALSAGYGLVDVQALLEPGVRGRVVVQGGVVSAPLEVVDGPAAGAGGGAGGGDGRLRSARLALGPVAGPVQVRVEVQDGGQVGGQAGVDGGPWRVVATGTLASLEPAAEVRVPDWAMGAVWYQVFPERFCNGEPGNDPEPGVGVFLKQWGSVWDEVELAELEGARVEAGGLSPWRSALAPGDSSGLHRAVVFRRRYGGDLQGVVQRLDAIAELGVTGLYLTPIFRAASLHKYDAADFRHIDDPLAGPGPVPRMEDGSRRWHEPGESEDPRTWTWTPADLYVRDTFIPAVRGRGLRIIFDGVWNHTGREFHAFADLLERGKESAYAGWYDVQFAPPMDQRPAGIAESIAHLPAGALMGWRAWDSRNGGLPAFTQRRVGEGERVALREQGRPKSGIPMPRQTDLAPGPKQLVMDVTSRWMDPFGDGSRRSGIDGWRLDVAPDVGLPFWRDWRRHVKGINPDALLIGEIWYPGWDYFHGVAFDGQMNYPFARAVVAFLQMQPTIDAEALGRRLRQVFINDATTDLVQMNVLTSHDTDRLASCLFNSPADYDQSGAVGTGSIYNQGLPPAEVFRRVELAVAIQATYQGSPIIYYGEEWGMHGADDPHSRKPVPWPDGPAMQNPADAGQSAVREVFIKWFTLRQHAVVGPVLRLGGTRHVASGSPGVFVFDRFLNGRVVRVGINRGEGPVRVKLGKGATAVVGPGAGEGGAELGAGEGGVWTWEQE